MDIYNDTDTLQDILNKLIISKSQFGDINIQMIRMIKNASEKLEGRQMDLAKKTTLESFNYMKNAIINIEDSIDYINKLLEILEIYFKCKFKGD